MGDARTLYIYLVISSYIIISSYFSTGNLLSGIIPGGYMYIYTFSNISRTYIST